eukprot:GFUD01032571.1.p1 GENE.GFUD01032571.1~~GFUD01032571.1.p1  ORF type:complete len:324 (-),score=94.56 GFUD01032571.1:182-1153(-)
MLKSCISKFNKLLIAPYCDSAKLSYNCDILSQFLLIKPAEHKMEDKLDKLGIADDELENIKQAWIAEQKEYRSRIVEKDPKDWSNKFSYLGGLDISFIVGDDVNACACYVVIDTNLELVYKDTKMVKMTAPYVPGFLAFREAQFLIDLVEAQKTTRPEVTPHALLVDGNGVLHPRQCGIACHIGVATGLPAVGVAKNLHQIQEYGDQFTRENVRERFSILTQAGQHITLATTEGRILGAALKTSAESSNPVYVSVGSGLSLASALELVNKVSKYRVPEPTRQADMISREFLRQNHPTERQKQVKKQPGKKMIKEKSTNHMENL